MTQCSDDEIEYEKECIDRSSKKARKLYRKNKLSDESAMKVTCDDDKEVMNRQKKTCILAHRETAFKLLREQQRNKKIINLTPDDYKKVEKAYREYLDKVKQDKLDAAKSSADTTKSSTKKECTDNEVYDKNNAKCYDSSSPKARDALIKKNLSKDDEKKVDCEKQNQVINMNSGRCIGITSITAKNLYTEQMNTNKMNFREVDLEKFKPTKKTKREPKSESKKNTIKKEKEIKEIKTQKIEIVEEDDTESDTESDTDEEEAEVKTKPKTKSKEEKEPIEDLSKDKKIEIENVIKLLRKYDETQDYKEKINLRNDLLVQKYNKSIPTRLNQQEYLFNINDETALSSVFDDDVFELSNNQKFLKKFISPFTGNSGVLLFHGVGVGKTCSALQIAENFMNFFDNKTLIIASKNLHSNFIKEIFDSKKVDTDSKTYNGCLNTKILNMIPNWNQLDNKTLEKTVNIIIKKYFSFHGYQKLVNIIQKNKDYNKDILKKSGITEDELKVKERELYTNYIKREFSDRVIIIDEVHNIRNPGLVSSDANDAKVIKQIPKILKEIMTHARNVRLVLLSATPMFDNESEIVDIINILSNNDKMLVNNSMTSLFDDKTNELKPKVKTVIEDFSKNYVSYMRGENPMLFPLRISPSVFDKSKTLKYEDHPVKTFKGEELKEEERIRTLELYKSTLSDKQETIIKKLKSKTKDDTEDDSNKQSYSDIVQISNVYFPVSEDLSVVDKFNTVFETVNNKPLKLNYRPAYKDLFSPNKINDYSPKIKSIIDAVDKSEGIVLIYSEYIYAGILPLCIALESHGYNKYNNKNIIQSNDKSKGSYITITAKQEISGTDAEKEAEFKTLVSKSNKDGEKIKIVIINQVAAEGYDFKNLREIHIMEPWYNLNKTEQIIGRGVRNRSHFALTEDKRNTTIYLHCALHKNRQIESVDYRKYRKAEEKQTRISQIEQIMKENSIDCSLNKNIMHFKNLPKLEKLTTSRNTVIKDYDMNDKDGSKICNFSTCDITCKSDITIVEQESNELDKNILDYEIKSITKRIVNFLVKNNYIFINKEELYTNLDYDERLINLSLSYLIESNYEFEVQSKKGRINVIDDVVIFIPIEISNRGITMNEYKLLKENNFKKQNKIGVLELDESIINTSQGSDFINKIYSEFDNHTKILKSIMDPSKIDKSLIYELIIDALSYEELKTFLKEASENYINSSFERDNDEMKEAMRRTCIFEVDGKYITANHYEGMKGFKEHNTTVNKPRDYIKDKITPIMKEIIKKRQSKNKNENNEPIAIREINKKGKKNENVTEFKVFFKSYRDCGTLKNSQLKEKINLSEIDTKNIIKSEYIELLEKEDIWLEVKKRGVSNRGNLCIILEYILTYYGLMCRPLVPILFESCM